MALAHSLLALPLETKETHFTIASFNLTAPFSTFASSICSKFKPQSFSFSPKSVRTSLQVMKWDFRANWITDPAIGRSPSGSLSVKSKPHDSEVDPLVDTFSEFKQLLLPIVDRNPYLTEGTKQATATTAALAKKYGAEITVVVIDEKEKETISEHDTQVASIRWHLSEGGFKEFKMLERLGEGNKPTAIIGEVADEMNMDLVIMSMEAIHSKHVDANLLAEFIPCPVLLLPL